MDLIAGTIAKGTAAHMLGITGKTEPAATTGLTPLLKDLRKNPAHAANRHPAPTRKALSKSGEYAQLALSDALLPTVNTGINSVDSTWNEANKRVSGLLQIGTTSFLDVLKAAAQGSVYGAIVGGIGGITGLGWQLIGSARTRNLKQLRHWGMFTAGMMGIGSLLGAGLRGYHAVTRSAREVSNTFGQSFL